MLLLIRFKKVYTTQVFDFPIDPVWTIRTFIEKSKIYLSEQTQINFQDIEIVEAGTKLREEGRNLESYVNPDLRFKDHFRLNLYTPAFYLRVKNLLTNLTTYECPICLDTNRNTNYIALACNHNLCTQCYSMMSIHRLTSCPLCRNSI